MTNTMERMLVVLEWLTLIIVALMLGFVMGAVVSA